MGIFMYIWYMSGTFKVHLWSVVYYDGLSQQITISHQTPGWKSLEALLDGKPWLCPQIWGGPADCQAIFTKYWLLGFFYFQAKQKKLATNC